MNDPKPTPEEIFTPFTPAPVVTPAPTQEQSVPKKPRRRTTTKKTLAAPEPKPEAPPRRKRRIVVAVRKPQSLKLPVAIMFEALANCKAGDGELLTKLLGILNGAGKKQRQRVLEALNKIFA